MSFEVALLIVFFLLVPLVQFLARAARAGQEPEPAQPADTPLSPAGTPSSVDRPPTREMQQILAPEDRTLVEGTAAPKREPAQKPHRPVAPAAGGSTGRGRSILAFRGPLDLRRAIVLRMVLGPCRASRPPDWPEGTE